MGSEGKQFHKRILVSLNIKKVRKHKKDNDEKHTMVEFK